MLPEQQGSQSFVVDPQAIRARALGVLLEFWPLLKPLVAGLLPLARTGATLALNIDKVPAFLLPAALRSNLPGPEEKEALLLLLQSLQNFEDLSCRDVLPDGFEIVGRDPYLVAANKLIDAIPDAWIAKWGPLAKWVLTG